MAPEKITTMKLKVDLQCEKCCKKVKKVLAKSPQITDQLYDEKKNIVTVKVVCCSPEKVRDKLCYKSGGSIKSIEIVLEPSSKTEATKQTTTKTEQPQVKTKDGKTAESTKSGTQGPKDNRPVEKVQDLKDTKPTKKVTFKDPPTVQVAAMNPEVAPVSVLAYPAPAQPVGLLYYGSPDGLTAFYGRPIYDSYGEGGPTYLCNHDQNPWEQGESGCTLF